jgi:hypothetical protein
VYFIINPVERKRGKGLEGMKTALHRAIPPSYVPDGMNIGKHTFQRYGIYTFDPIYIEMTGILIKGYVA